MDSAFRDRYQTIASGSQLAAQCEMESSGKSSAYSDLSPFSACSPAFTQSKHEYRAISSSQRCSWDTLFFLTRLLFHPSFCLSSTTNSFSSAENGSLGSCETPRGDCFSDCFNTDSRSVCSSRAYWTLTPHHSTLCTLTVFCDHVVEGQSVWRKGSWPEWTYARKHSYKIQLNVRRENRLVLKRNNSQSQPSGQSDDSNDAIDILSHCLI